MHVWGAVPFSICLTPTYHGNSISAQGNEFCSHLTQLDTHTFFYLLVNTWTVPFYIKKNYNNFGDKVITLVNKNKDISSHVKRP